MIQRIQTIWLLLAAVAGFFTTQIPLYVGTLAGEQIKEFKATQSLLIFAVAIVAALLALIAIFLFKNRKTQMKFVAFGILAAVGVIALIVWQVGDFQKDNPFLSGSYYWGSLLPIAMIVFFILAAINIRKDNKLVKSLDRLR